MISKANIQRLGVRLQREGRPIPDQTLEKDYVLSWVLTGLSRLNINDLLVFKGGTALKKIYFHDYRYSEDLDFTLIDSTIKLDAVLALFERAFSVIKKESNIDLSFEESEETDNTYNLLINYSGPLEAALGRRQIKVDITIREKILFPIQKLPLLKEHEEYSDIPYDVMVAVYDIREIFIEKLCCLCSSARIQPRDIYDVWHLFKSSDLKDPDFLIGEFQQKADFKEPGGQTLSNALTKKEARYRATWISQLKNQAPQLPDFDRVIRELKKALRENGYI